MKLNDMFRQLEMGGNMFRILHFGFSAHIWPSCAAHDVGPIRHSLCRIGPTSLLSLVFLIQPISDSIETYRVQCKLHVKKRLARKASRRGQGRARGPVEGQESSERPKKSKAGQETPGEARRGQERDQKKHQKSCFHHMSPYQP